MNKLQFNKYHTWIIKREKRLRARRDRKRKKFNGTDFDYLLTKVGKGYENFLKSKYWREVKKLVLKRDKYKCIICGSSKELNIHHSSYKNHFNEHNHLEDLDTLCRKHHQEYHETVYDFLK